MNFLITILCILLVMLMFYFVYIKPRSTDAVYANERSYDNIYYDPQNIEHQILDYVTGQREKLPGGGKLLGGQTLQQLMNNSKVMSKYKDYYNDTNDKIRNESNDSIKARLLKIPFKYDQGTCEILTRIGVANYTHLYDTTKCSFFGNDGLECWISAFMNTYILAGFDLKQGADNVADGSSPTGKGLLSTECIRQVYMSNIKAHESQSIDEITKAVSHLYNVHCSYMNIEVLNYSTLNTSFHDMTNSTGSVPVYHLPWFIRSRLVCFAMNITNWHYKACCVVDGSTVFVVNDGHLEGNHEKDICSWTEPNGPAVPIPSYVADVATNKLKYYTLAEFMDMYGKEPDNGYTIELIVNNTGDAVVTYKHGNQFDDWHTAPIIYNSIHVHRLNNFYEEYVSPMMAFVLETPAYFYLAGLKNLQQCYDTVFTKYGQPKGLEKSTDSNDKYVKLFDAKNPATCETYVDYVELYKKGITPLAALVPLSFDLDANALDKIKDNPPSQTSDDILPEVLSTMRYNLFLKFQAYGEKMPNLIIPYLHPKQLYEAMQFSASKHDRNRLLAFFETFLVKYVKRFYPIQMSKNQQRWYNLSVADIIGIVETDGTQKGTEIKDLTGPNAVWPAQP